MGPDLSLVGKVSVRPLNKYNPNAEETEEKDGLIAGRLRLYKVLRQSEARTGRTHNLLPLQNNTQQPMESNSKDKGNVYVVK